MSSNGPSLSRRSSLADYISAIPRPRLASLRSRKSTASLHTKAPEKQDWEKVLAYGQRVRSVAYVESSGNIHPSILPLLDEHKPVQYILPNLTSLTWKVESAAALERSRMFLGPRVEAVTLEVGAARSPKLNDILEEIASHKGLTAFAFTLHTNLPEDLTERFHDNVALEKSIVPLTRDCRRLHTLGVVVNAAELENDEVYATRAVCSRSLLRLHVGHSWVRNPLQTAVLLSHLAPYLETLKYFNEKNRAGIVEANAQAWQRVAELLPHLQHIRLSERKLQPPPAQYVPPPKADKSVDATVSTADASVSAHPEVVEFAVQAEPVLVELGVQIAPEMADMSIDATPVFVEVEVMAVPEHSEQSVDAVPQTEEKGTGTYHLPQLF
ncbi:hypothetical protein BN946_scf185013.g97 [Trametes cinnabarina]|uniref:Uncharacterized protein n=1 Tax=Pycnoporus cinnabarinus TaxID=5643 RepID=A0A060SG15_PYCCI|nr:hypothetical protein BN946_scf185013.g97 [Trametes cinnabarina]